MATPNSKCLTETGKTTTGFKGERNTLIIQTRGDVMHCEICRGIKLLEIGLKVYERVIERHIRERVELHDNQFGFSQAEVQWMRWS